MRPMKARMNVSSMDEPIRTRQAVTLRSGGILVARYRVEDEESQIYISSLVYQNCRIEMLLWQPLLRPCPRMVPRNHSPPLPFLVHVAIS
jgi:hypothetical protein